MGNQENDAQALDPVAVYMLDALSALEEGKSAAPDDIARGFAETRRKPNDGRDLYKRYRQAVKEQAIHLARAGRVEILRRGEPVDPNDFKGVWRLRLKR
ncbi:MAG: DUF3253 domain-containing protein [Alphaproteobacteria bacterium]